MALDSPYPILTLPFDIISQIFVYCLPQEDDALPWRTEAPLLLAGICRHWRDVALATHELWNTMHLNLRAHTILKITPLLDFWLPRAGNLPRSMSLIYRGESEFNYLASIGDAALDALVDIMRHYAQHWSSLELHVPFKALLRLRAPPDGFSSLRKITLNDSSRSPQTQVIAAFSKAPKLRELHIMAGVSTADLDLPYQQMEILRLDNSNPRDCVQALNLVPNITKLTSTLWTFRGFGAAASASTLRLTHLESIRVVLSHTRGPALLSCLTLPALKHLEIDLQGLEEIALLTSLLLRSSCFLRHLSVKFGPSWGADHFTQLFTALDSLEELQVRKADASFDIAFALLKAQPTLFLPNLRSLHVERTNFNSDSEDPVLLADLLEARWNVPSDVTLPVQLRSFRLNSPLTIAPEYKTSAMHRLCHLRVQGMMIEITSERSWLRPELWAWYIHRIQRQH
ncbi:hypothetical protein B0H11DRAFT_2235835 [Mycena galericulata]|nr:hypothetical protein B0H11DRAFT_2235835 [Mycena galericulata]